MGASDDLAASFRLAVTGELRLFGAGAVALLAWGLWVAATGAALSFLADAVGISLAPQPWTGGLTVVVAVGALLWVIAPAPLAVRLLADRLTNHSGNLAQRYRYRHPAALLAPPILVVAAAAAGIAILDSAWPLYPVLVFGALFVLVRTLAYSHRTFALSAPRAVQGAALLTAPLLAVALLVGGAVAAGRGSFLFTVVDGFGGAVGIDGLGAAIAGQVTVGAVMFPTVVAAPVAVSVGLSALYLLAQTVASVAARIREPTVQRSALRTGQRYPEFARPAAGRQAAPSADGMASSTDSGPRAARPDPADSAQNGDPNEGDPPEATGATGGPSTPPGDMASVDRDADTSVAENVSNTRVYSPPAEFDGEADLARDGQGEAGNAGGTGAQTAECPACGVAHNGDVAFCPTCGEPL